MMISKRGSSAQSQGISVSQTPFNNFHQLTGGANKNTYSFEADVGAESAYI